MDYVICEWISGRWWAEWRCPEATFEECKATAALWSSWGITCHVRKDEEYD